MTTRRIISTEKNFLDQDDKPEEKSNISPAVPKHVIFKLLGFTLAMIIVPIGSYFLTVNTIFQGNSSYAGGMAALLANVVLVAYVIVAMNEDESEGKDAAKKESKKER
ncbi:VMA21-like domain-containing protein [Drechmeria coniospora]|uniref:VMA21-like domain-containing protein n=1 Tax=Drechmeria coniospora TaxID=98403 RepID=A0A151GFX5_DRECN|nr:VMA21-like domain-containing protein [Drechmeria coniospora]KYK56007.1 VMA21-like domain-containing protein [Drechmeria coniospora]